MSGKQWLLGLGFFGIAAVANAAQTPAVTTVIDSSSGERVPTKRPGQIITTNEHASSTHEDPYVDETNGGETATVHGNLKPSILEIIDELTFDLKDLCLPQDSDFLLGMADVDGDGLFDPAWWDECEGALHIWAGSGALDGRAPDLSIPLDKAPEFDAILLGDTDAYVVNGEIVQL